MHKREIPDLRQISNPLGKGLKCFNCRKTGHIQNRCPKPRLECKYCKRLGRTIETCSRNKQNSSKGNTLMCRIVPTTNDECYHVMCKVNGYVVNGYIDYQVVAIREREAQQLNLSGDVNQWIYVNGYGGGKVQTLCTVSAILEVDLVKAEVSLVVVLNELQTLAIVIGQPFISKANVVLVLKNGQLRLYESEMNCGKLRIYNRYKKLNSWQRKTFPLLLIVWVL